MPLPSTESSPPVAKKKPVGKEQPKQYGTLIRVSDEFADAVRQASSIQKVSIRDFADTYFMAIARKVYRDVILKEAKRVTGKEDDKP